ncbi:hypothetical protein MJO29_001612 [Puccinia striiformis f. sp. tritici]|nr:hypothetical protein MJO29_001612 [Puccinia striiformis f. sp. tritici]
MEDDTTVRRQSQRRGINNIDESIGFPGRNEKESILRKGEIFFPKREKLFDEKIKKNEEEKTIGIQLSDQVGKREKKDEE